jgi:hypothetical protein
MALNNSSSEINLSKSKVGFPYYQEQLKSIWTEVKRSPVYEYDARILQAGNDTMKMGRKPGGHNSRK